MRSLCVEVAKDRGESVRKILLEMGLLDISLKVKRRDGTILFPVLSAKGLPAGLPVMDMEFEERSLAETDYKKLMHLPDGLQEDLPTSFDVIGDVAVIKLPDPLLPYVHEVGAALRRVLPRLRLVALDRGVKGELRVRDLEIIAGLGELETLHTEYGVKLLIDPSKAYFNPRLSNERMRIASLVRPGEKVIDMFAGVGPFSIVIAKHASPAIVYAIDLNHEAVELMKRNIALNRVKNVVAIEGDARTVIFDLPNPDRMIMNLPHNAVEFFHDALTRLNLGGTIHLYHICEKDEICDTVERLKAEASGSGVEIEVARQEELKTYSPSMSVFSLDIVLRQWR